MQEVKWILSMASDCMSPSDMELRIGTIQDYNNEIVIATDAQDLGLNDGVNTKPVPPKQTQNVQEHLPGHRRCEHLHKCKHKHLRK